jgi:hypothetical protein
MSKVDDKAREDYERGQNDRKSDFYSQTVTDVTAQHPGTEAYYKGRDNEPLDDDKK